jgi:hypothetical protein
MKVESIRVDKTAIKVNGEWKFLTPNVVEYVKKVDVWKKDVDLEFSKDGKFVEKIILKPTSDNKTKLMCLSYAKDLVCAGKVDIKELIDIAEKCADYVEGK